MLGPSRAKCRGGKGELQSQHYSARLVGEEKEDEWEDRRLDTKCNADPVPRPTKNPSTSLPIPSSHIPSRCRPLTLPLFLSTFKQPFQGPSLPRHRPQTRCFLSPVSARYIRVGSSPAAVQISNLPHLRLRRDGLSGEGEREHIGYLWMPGSRRCD